MLMPVALAMSWWGWHSADPAAMVSKRVSSCIPHLFFVLFFKATRPRDIFSTYFFKNFLNFIFDCWVFVPVHRLSLVILSRGCSLVSLHRLLSVVSSFVEHRL